jgi:hypothetical protein
MDTYFGQIRGGAGYFHLNFYLELGRLVVKSHLMTDVGKGVLWG